MSRLLKRALAPVWRLTNPVRRAVLAKFDTRVLGLLEATLQPVRDEMRGLNEKMDRILDIHLAPEVLRDFRAHNEALRAIQADCDLIREMNPLLNGVLRDLVRLQLQFEELAWRLEVADAGSAANPPGREAA